LGSFIAIWELANYIRRRREKKKSDILAIRKNQAAARCEALGHMAVFVHEVSSRVVEEKRFNRGFIIKLEDGQKRMHSYRIYDDCHFEYQSPDDLRRWAK